MSRAQRIPCTGPIVVSHGFRLFFLLTLIFCNDRDPLMARGLFGSGRTAQPV